MHDCNSKSERNDWRKLGLRTFGNQSVNSHSSVWKWLCLSVMGLIWALKWERGLQKGMWQTNVGWNYRRVTCFIGSRFRLVHFEHLCTKAHLTFKFAEESWTGSSSQTKANEGLVPPIILLFIWASPHMSQRFGPQGRELMRLPEN